MNIEYYAMFNSFIEYWTTSPDILVLALNADFFNSISIFYWQMIIECFFFMIEFYYIWVVIHRLLYNI